MKYFLLPFLLLFLYCTGKKEKAPAPQPTATKTETPAITPDKTVLSKPTPTAPEYSGPTAELPPPPDYDTTQWAEIIRLDKSILLDIRYATANNFVEEKMYDCPRCFLRPAVAKAVVAAHKSLQKKGYGLKMYDCYRPRPIQWKLWKKVPDARYVADPRKGSMHNRGAAVDLTIVDKNGKELDMGTGYDFFGEEAYPAYTDLPKQVLDNRKLLAQTMDAHNFRPTSTEWWHYSYKPKSYQIDDWLWPCD